MKRFGTTVIAAPLPVPRDHWVTPMEPAAPQGASVGVAQAVVGHQAMLGTAFCRVEAAVASSCGAQRSSNEDAHSQLGDRGQLFIVADGVGGGAMAALASRELVSHLHSALDGQRIDDARVARAVLSADRAVAQRIGQVTDAPGAATFVLCAPANLFASRWLVAWVGDCRVYRLARHADTGIELLTHDDSFRHLNETPPSGGLPDDPARMVGNGATLGASVGRHALARGDLLVLCSDGVHKHLATGDWSRILRQPVTLLQRCQALIATARANGSIDDATVLLLRRDGLLCPHWITRLMATGGAGRRAR